MLTELLCFPFDVMNEMTILLYYWTSWWKADILSDLSTELERCQCISFKPILSEFTERIYLEKPYRKSSCTWGVHIRVCPLAQGITSTNVFTHLSYPQWQYAILIYDGVENMLSFSSLNCSHSINATGDKPVVCGWHSKSRARYFILAHTVVAKETTSTMISNFMNITVA